MTKSKHSSATVRGVGIQKAKAIVSRAMSGGKNRTEAKSRTEIRKNVNNRKGKKK